MAFFNSDKTLYAIQLIPDYDQIRKPIQNSPSFHDEMEITSNILKLRLSYKWRPLIDDNVTETIRRWATFDPIERPHLLFLSNIFANYICSLIWGGVIVALM